MLLEMKIVILVDTNLFISKERAEVVPAFALMCVLAIPAAIIFLYLK